MIREAQVNEDAPSVAEAACRLCGDVGELCDSHVLPESGALYDGKHRYFRLIADPREGERGVMDCDVLATCPVVAPTRQGVRGKP